jgi:chromosome segregation ATPase
MNSQLGTDFQTNLKRGTISTLTLQAFLSKTLPDYNSLNSIPALLNTLSEYAQSVLKQRDALNRGEKEVKVVESQCSELLLQLTQLETLNQSIGTSLTSHTNENKELVSKLSELRNKAIAVQQLKEYLHRLTEISELCAAIRAATV